MWLVDPEIMCRKHLLGEHLELHMLLGAMQKGKSVKGYIDSDIFEPKSLFSRHTELKVEMKIRGYNHTTEMSRSNVLETINRLPESQLNHRMNKKASLKVLLSRCEDCKKLALTKRGL
jgi:hypothetical protein